MRKLLQTLWLPLIFLVLPLQLEAQLPSFDTSYIIASSPDFDYKNPTHCTNPFENVQTDPFANRKNWIAYEKHKDNSTSNIILRQYDYNGYSVEIELTTDSNVLNINPSISGDYENYTIVWQSNKRGNWDIYYSILSSGSWSEPQLVDSSAIDKTNPCLLQANYFPNYYLLAYEVNNQIKIYVYYNFWRSDTTLASPDSFSRPSFIGSNSEDYLSFLVEGDSLPKRINSKTLFYNTNTNKLNLGPNNLIFAPTTYRAGNLPNFGAYMTFDHDTLGNMRSLYLNMPSGVPRILANSLPGDMTHTVANIWPVVVFDGQIYFQALAAINKIHDSTFIAAIGPYYNHARYIDYKKFYLGDTSVNVDLSMSNVSYSGPPFYIKYRLVWEQEVNGKTALVESYVLDFNTSLVPTGLSTPNQYRLHQNYPNPFNPETKIKFEIPKQGFVSLKVYDVSGREVSALFNGELSPGVYEYSFDGSGLGSGVYFYKLQGGDFTQTRRMVLVK